MLYGKKRKNNKLDASQRRAMSHTWNLAGRQLYAGDAPADAGSRFTGTRSTQRVTVHLYYQ